MQESDANDTSKSGYILFFALSKFVLSKRFNILEMFEEGEPVPSLKVVFTNGIVWRCIPESIFNNDDKIFKDEQVVVVKSELLDADIGKSSYEISFISQNGQLIFKSIETISPLNLIIKK